LADDEAEAPVLRKEYQPILAIVHINLPFARACILEWAMARWPDLLRWWSTPRAGHPLQALLSLSQMALWWSVCGWPGLALRFTR